MSEYADGFDDGKGEKFDELMVEIVALREQVEIANKSADDQMFQKRKAEAENAALHQDASSKWAFLEWRDRAEKAEAENATLRLNLSVTMEELGEMRDRAEKAEAENAAQLKELHRISEALGTNEGHSSVTHIETLREQLKDCSAAFDKQQEMLDRNAEQLANKQARIDALMFEYCPIEMSLEQIMEWKKHQRPVQEG
jgi:chromosome segregation ATPase